MSLPALPSPMPRVDLLRLLTTRILAFNPARPLRVGIDGPDASGKTTLADELAEVIQRASRARPLLRASIDSFHNPREIRYRQGENSPHGYYEDAFNLAALKERLLAPLGPGGSRRVQTARYDYRAERPVESPFQPVSDDAILLFDGVFLQRPELAGCFDLLIYLQVSFETVLARAVQRDLNLFGGGLAAVDPGAAAQLVIARYTQKYIPAQHIYLESCHPGQNADIVIINDHPERPELLKL